MSANQCRSGRVNPVISTSHPLKTPTTLARIGELLPFSLLASVFALPVSETLSDILYISTVVLALIVCPYRHLITHIKENPIIAWLLGFVVMIVLGLLYSKGSSAAIMHSLHKLYWVFCTPLLLLAFQHNKQQPANLKKRVIDFFLYANILVLAISYTQFLYGILSSTHATSTVTVIRNHIAQNFFMSLAAAFWLYRWYNQTHLRHRWINGLLFLLASINIFLSSGRTGYVNWCLLIIYVHGHQYGWKCCLVSILPIGLLIGALFYTSSTFEHRIKETITDIQAYQHGNGHTNDGIRIVQAKNSLLAARKKPWIGYGTGGFHAAYYALPKQDRNATDTFTIHPLYSSENTYMNILVEHGLLGLLFIVLFCVRLFYETRYMSTQHAFFTRSVLIAFFTGALATAFFYSSFSAHFFSIMLVACYTNYRERSDRADIKQLGDF